jgi:hypothetical protein
MRLSGKVEGFNVMKLNSSVRGVNTSMINGSVRVVNISRLNKSAYGQRKRCLVFASETSIEAGLVTA